jgi:hypothetical protein
MKLFIQELLPSSVHKAIFVDTDAFFLTDPTHLWRTFSDPVLFPTGTGFAIPMHPDQRAPEWKDASKICSCILLLDLARLRELTLMDSAYYRRAGRKALSPPAFEEMFGKPGQHGYEGVKLGDQGYWWAVVNGTNSAGASVGLSFEWEVSACLLDMYGTGARVGEDGASAQDEAPKMLHLYETPYEGTTVLPKLVHLCVSFPLSGFSSVFDKMRADEHTAIASTARQCTGSGRGGKTRSTGSTSISAGARRSCTTSGTNGSGSTLTALSGPQGPRRPRRGTRSRRARGSGRWWRWRWWTM